eukprot:NODE_173_length_15916_cov_0.397673.p1 type:complete len:649 gc:universal NODE_173_length_15916_cov_0.397673:3413-5359(+)
MNFYFEMLLLYFLIQLHLYFQASYSAYMPPIYANSHTALNNTCIIQYEMNRNLEMSHILLNYKQYGTVQVMYNPFLKLKLSTIIMPGQSDPPPQFPVGKSINYEYCTHLLFLGANDLLTNHPYHLVSRDDYSSYGFTVFNSFQMQKDYSVSSFIINVKYKDVIEDLLASSPNVPISTLLLDYFKSHDLPFGTVSDALLASNSRIMFCGTAISYYTNNILILIKSNKPQHRFYKMQNVINEYTALSNISSLVSSNVLGGCWDNVANNPVNTTSSVISTINSKLKILNAYDSCNTTPERLRDVYVGSDNWSPHEAKTKQGKSLLQNYLKSIKSLDVSQFTNASTPNNTRGIVFLSFDENFSEVYASLQIIRLYLNMSLPIEIFSHKEISDVHIKQLESLSDVKVLDIRDEVVPNLPLNFQPNAKNYHLKVAALLMSSFSEILYLDSDCMPVKNADFMFKSKEYLETGLVMFMDMWTTMPSNPIWGIFDIDCVSELEMESGAWLVNKKVHYYTLLLALYIMSDHEYWFQFILGDKDVMRYTSRYLHATHYVDPGFMGEMGYRKRNSDEVCGFVMVQQFRNELMFFHANMLKCRDRVGKDGFTTIQMYNDTRKIGARTADCCIMFDGSEHIEKPLQLQGFLNDGLFKYKNYQ